MWKKKQQREFSHVRYIVMTVSDIAIRGEAILFTKCLRYFEHQRAMRDMNRC